MEIIVGRKGTQRVPITDTSVSREHCKLIIKADDTYIVENLSANGTFVNGNSIIRTTVTSDTTLRLGTNFIIAVSELLPSPITNNSSIENLQKQKALDTNQERYEKEFRRLKLIYDRYSTDKIAIQKEASMANFYRMLPMTLMAIVSLGAACILD